MRLWAIVFNSVLQLCESDHTENKNKLVAEYCLVQGIRSAQSGHFYVGVNASSTLQYCPVLHNLHT